MILINDGVTLARTLHGNAGPHVKRLLSLRRAQLGDTWPEAAWFHLAGPGDTLADAETAIGFPLALDDEPTCEWAIRHDGVIELTWILSDDGPAQVILVPHSEGVDTGLTAFVRLAVEVTLTSGDHAQSL